MEPDDLGLTPYYHHHHHHPQPQTHPHQPPSPSPTVANGMLQTTTNDIYPHNSAPSAVETGVRRKRGRPRKYGTPEQAAAAKRLASSSPPTSVPSLANKKDLSLGVSGSSATSFKKSSIGNTGKGFTPHIISVAAGEDISQKIVSFMQLRKQEICVLSASGLIANACLNRPLSSGSNITYEGRFNILSLCGSYVRTDLGGSTGGLSVCLSSNDGQIIGGGIHGPLIAASPVQVIVGTFAIEGKKESVAAIKVDASTNKLPSPNMGPSLPNLSFLSGTDSSIRNVDEQQNIDGYQFMIQNRNLPINGFDFSGRVSHGAQRSPKSGDYDRFQD